MDIIEEYENYANKIGDRRDLYRSVMKRYSVKAALYPGSHIDIAPSLVIEDVTYVDKFKGASKFFKQIEVIQSYIETNKEYIESPKIKYIDIDYSKLTLNYKVDLIISQYAGFVGQETKKYLKDGGILLCNDSHGDATLAYTDDEYEFIGVAEPDGNIKTVDLDAYFKFAKNKSIDVNKVRETMKGPKYKKTVANYLFKKVKVV